MKTLLDSAGGLCGAEAAKYIAVSSILLTENCLGACYTPKRTLVFC